MRTVLLVVFAGISLIACDRIENTIRAFRGEPPSRKAGLWQLTLTRSYFPQPVVFLECFDKLSDAQHPLFVQDRDRPGECDRWTTVRRPDGFHVGGVRCRPGRSGFAVSGESGSSFTMDDWRVLSRAEGQLPAGTLLTRHSVWVYKGACPKSIRPGQEQTPDGSVFPIGAEVLTDHPIDRP